MTRQAIETAWGRHREQGWPDFSSPNQGQLMTLDTVIAGCVVYYLDSPDGLDERRVTIVKDCLNDLDELTGELDGDSQAYFLRLRELCELLLVTEPQR
jgi:hypothetical protein